MKQGRALPEVLMELKRQNEAKKDFISPAQAFHLEDDGATFGITHLNTGKQEAFATTDLFHRQVGSTLGIPAKYYDQMRKLKPGLLAENVNAWFGDRDQSYMIRSMDYGNGMVARALLSDRYSSLCREGRDGGHQLRGHGKSAVFEDRESQARNGCGSGGSCAGRCGDQQF